MVAIFLATFGFGAAIIFLPLYFQIVQGADVPRRRATSSCRS